MTKSISGKRRLLIIDGNRSRFKDLVTGLEEANIEVNQVVSRADAVPTAISFAPDLILLNLFLDSSNTLHLLRDLRTAPEKQGTKILVLTAHYSKGNIAECIKNGATDFIVEPFDARLVLQRVRYQLQDRETYSPEDLRAEPTQVLAGFQLVYDCLRIVAEVKDIHISVHECLKQVAQLSKSTRVNVILADIERNAAIVVASSDDPKLDHMKVELEKYPEVREVMLKGSIIYIKDITQNALTRNIKAQVKTIDINSLLIFPIRHRQETIGTLNIRLGKDALEVSDKHLKTFYMVALSLGSKVAAKKLLSKLGS